MPELQELFPYIPNHMAFAQSEFTDSRTIIGRSGLELLKGYGDGLAIVNEETSRVQIILEGSIQNVVYLT